MHMYIDLSNPPDETYCHIIAPAVVILLVVIVLVVIITLVVCWKIKKQSTEETDATFVSELIIVRCIN